MEDVKGILEHASLKFAKVGITASKTFKAFVALVQPEVKHALAYLASACVANTGAEPEDLTVQETANCTHAEPPDIAIQAEAISSILSTKDVSLLETGYPLEYLQIPRDLIYFKTCSVLGSFKKVNSGEYYDEKEEKEDKNNEGEDERSEGKQKEEEQGDLIGRNTPAPLKIQKQDSPQKDSSSRKMHSMYNDVIKNISGECQLRGPLHEHTLKSALVNQEIEKTAKSLEIPDKPTKDEHVYRNEYCMTSVPPIVPEQWTELQSKIDPCDLLALKKKNSHVKLLHPAHRIAQTDLQRGFQKCIQYIPKAWETICLYSTSRDVASYVILYDDLFSLMPFKDQIFFEYWRLNSLILCPQVSPFMLLIPRLAQSGFYYDEVLDDILCFSSKVCKRDWTNRDNPALVHQDISPYCLHAFFQDERNIPLTLENYTLLNSSTRPSQMVCRINRTQDDIVPQNRSSNQKVACKIFRGLNYFPDSFSSLSNDKSEISGATGTRGKSTECSANEPRLLPSKALHPTKSQESHCDGILQGEGDPSSHSEEPCLYRSNHSKFSSKLVSTSSCLGQNDGTSSSVRDEELSTSNLKNISQSSLRNCKHCSFREHNLESAESSPIQPSAKNSKKLVSVDNDLGGIFAPGEEPMDNDFREKFVPGAEPMDNDLGERFVPVAELMENDLREKCLPRAESMDNDLRERFVPGAEPMDNDLRKKYVLGAESNNLKEKFVPGTEPMDNDLRDNFFCSNALFADMQSRVTSFTGWPKQATHDPKLLADAGFCYSGNISKVCKLPTARIAPTVGDGKLQDKINKKRQKKEVMILKSSPSNHSPFMIQSSHHLSKTTILEPIDSRLLTEIYSNDDSCENQ